MLLDGMHTWWVRGTARGLGVGGAVPGLLDEGGGVPAIMMSRLQCVTRQLNHSLQTCERGITITSRMQADQECYSKTASALLQSQGLTVIWCDMSFV